MRHTVRTVLSVAALVALAVSLFVPQALAGGENVTFVNKSGDTRYVLAVYGEAKKCEEKDQSQNLVVEPGESVVLESGGAPACYCVGKVTTVSACYAWERARPGSKQRITF